MHLRYTIYYLYVFVHCQAKEGVRVVTEYELELIGKREKELERSKNELQVLHTTLQNVKIMLLVKQLELKLSFSEGMRSATYTYPTSCFTVLVVVVVVTNV